MFENGITGVYFGNFPKKVGNENLFKIRLEQTTNTFCLNRKENPTKRTVHHHN